MPASNQPSRPPLLHTLSNGVRVLALEMPQLQTVAVSVFVRCGSLHEDRATSGIGHVVEHMVFKGTAERDARRINLDAERLGAEVNAHTDKDHTAFHMQGLARHLPEFVRMLGGLVLQPSFPADELERERSVLLHEYTEDEDDPLSVAYRLLDRSSWGSHAAAQPVIGSRRNIERFTRDDLVGWVQRQYSADRILVGVAGGVEAGAVLREAEAVFGALPPAASKALAPPQWVGGIASKRLAGSGQAHLVLGFPLPGLTADDPAGAVAAALFGEGMSSPLMDRLREQRALAYYAACSADVVDLYGQFVVEVSTAPDKIEESLRELGHLLVQQAGRIDPVDLERARNQLAVRRLRQDERSLRRLEDAVLAVFALGRLRAPAEELERLLAVDAAALRALFERLLGHPPALALTGQLGRAASERAREALAAGLAPPAAPA